MACDPCCGLIPVKTGLKICAVVRIVMCLLFAAAPAYIVFISSVIVAHKDMPFSTGAQTKEAFLMEKTASLFIAGLVLLIEIINIVLSVVLIVLVDKPPAKRLFIPSGISSVLSLIYLLALFAGFFVARPATFLLSFVFLPSTLMTSYTGMLVRAVVSFEKKAAAAAAGPQQTWNVVSPTGGVYEYNAPVYGQQGFGGQLPPPPPPQQPQRQQTPEEPKYEAS